MGSETFSVKVDGMICPQCEDEIAHALLMTRGIICCETSYRKSQVIAEYDPKLLSSEKISKILSELGYPPGNGKSGLRADLIGAAAVLALVIAIPWLTGLVPIPMAESGTGYGALFVIGVLTGVHCVGMCGGIMLTQRNVFRYNAGRLLGYTLMGGLFGLLGTAFQFDTQTKSMLFTICGLLVVLVGLKMWGIPFFRRISLELTKPCRFRGTSFVVGILTGLMPCGALSSLWILAASSGSWQTGAVSMLSFGLGTCVFMLLFGLFGLLIPKKNNKYFLKCSTVLIVALGLTLMLKGLRLIG